MDIGDVVEFNANGCCWKSFGTMLCQIIGREPHNVVTVEILDKRGCNYEDLRSRGYFGNTSTNDTFRCHTDYLRRAESTEAIAIDVQEYL